MRTGISSSPPATTGNTSGCVSFWGWTRWREAPEFLHNADRIANREEMTARLTAATVQMTKADLLAACEAQGVPAGPINDMAEVMADPQVMARGMQIELGGVPGVRSPFPLFGCGSGA